MPKNRQINLVIDTNIWVSFIISEKHAMLDDLLFSGKARILFSTELTITKPKLKKYFSPEGFKEMFNVFDPFIDLIEVKSYITVCRDIKDNFLLSLAKDGKADYLLTGDFDLLDLKKFGKTKIITIAQFSKIMKLV